MVMSVPTDKDIGNVHKDYTLDRMFAKLWYFKVSKESKTILIWK